MAIYDFVEDVPEGGRSRHRLLMDEDFSWSEVPRRRRVRAAEARNPGARRAAQGRADGRGTGSRESVSRQSDSRFDARRFSARGSGPRRADVRGSLAPGLDAQGTHDAIAADDLLPDIYGVVDHSAGGPGGRRTIVITGHGSERYLPTRSRRREASLRLHERSSFKPDRIALWAFLLALALLLGATTSSHAAVLVQHLHP